MNRKLAIFYDGNVCPRHRGVEVACLIHRTHDEDLVIASDVYDFVCDCFLRLYYRRYLIFETDNTRRDARSFPHTQTTLRCIVVAYDLIKSVIYLSSRHMPSDEF